MVAEDLDPDQGHENEDVLITEIIAIVAVIAIPVETPNILGTIPNAQSQKIDMHHINHQSLNPREDEIFKIQTNECILILHKNFPRYFLESLSNYSFMPMIFKFDIK